MSEENYVPFLEQTYRYFARPHQGVPAVPIVSRAAWRGEDIAGDPSWRTALTEEEIAELKAAVVSAKETGKAMGALTRKDFPLPTLAARISDWRRAITSGLGLQVVAGVPVADWLEGDAEIFFWCFGLHLGRPGAQNDACELLGHVCDTGADKSDPFVRQYMTAQNIPFHCDAADAVGLLCLNKAKSGGESRIASSVAVFNEILKRRPDLAPRLFEPFLLDTRQEKATGARYAPIPPCQYADGVLRTFWHSEYFRTVERHQGVTLGNEEHALLDLYDEIAAEPGFHLDMDLEPGDIQLISNHTIIHARTDYIDYPEPARKRHLLRLWLTLEDETQ